MMHRPVFNLILVAMASVLAGLAQQAPLVVNPNFKLMVLKNPVTSDGEESLSRKYGAPATRDALTLALRDEDKRVRALAAIRLVDFGKDVAPDLRFALEAEGETSVRLGFALQLGRLGDPAGVTVLRGACLDGNLDLTSRMMAAQYADQLNSEICLPAILSILAEPHDTQASVMALGSLEYHHDRIRVEQLLQLRQVIEPLLSSKDAGERLGAASVLGRFGDGNSAQRLREALAWEQDESVRRQVAASLAKLCKKF